MVLSRPSLTLFSSIPDRSGFLPEKRGCWFHVEGIDSTSLSGSPGKSRSLAAVYPVRSQPVHEICGIACIVQIQASPIGKRRQSGNQIDGITDQDRVEVAEVGRHNDQRAFGGQTSDFFQFAPNDQFFAQPAPAASEAEKTPLFGLEQAVKKERQKFSGEQKGLNAKGADNFF